MKKPSVEQLIKKGELQAVEFKENFGEDIIETLCAFANTEGGTVVVGVSDKREVKGFQLGHHSLKDWANQIFQGIGLHPSIHVHRVKGKPVASIEIHESKLKPVMYRGRTFKRVGSSTRQMTMEELTRVVLKSAGLTWDVVPETRASFDDIDKAQVKEFVRLANEKKRRLIPPNTPLRELFEKLGLAHKGELTRAAILLFGKEPHKFYSQAAYKVGRFRNETLIVDDKEIEGNLFQQVEGVMGYFREKLETRFERTGRPQRNVIWEYPLDALREAVINSACHRDYMINGQSQVRIYDDHVFIMNPGQLPEGLSAKSLKTSHPSILRNKLIGEIFFYAGLIEKWGSGISTMITESVKAGLPEPTFDDAGGFSVTFYTAAPQATPHVTPQEADERRTSTVQVADKYRTSNGQVAEIKKLIKYCVRPRRIKEIMASLKIKRRETFIIKYLRPLLKDGVLAMTDPKSPNSPQQKYLTTPKGLGFLNAERKP